MHILVIDNELEFVRRVAPWNCPPILVRCVFLCELFCRALIVSNESEKLYFPNWSINQLENGQFATNAWCRQRSWARNNQYTRHEMTGPFRLIHRSNARILHMSSFFNTPGEKKKSNHCATCAIFDWRMMYSYPRRNRAASICCWNHVRRHIAILLLLFFFFVYIAFSFALFPAGIPHSFRTSSSNWRPIHRHIIIVIHNWTVDTLISVSHWRDETQNKFNMFFKNYFRAFVAVQYRCNWHEAVEKFIIFPVNGEKCAKNALERKSKTLH